jgi:hypothetical protein
MFFITLGTIKIPTQKSNKMVVFTEKGSFYSVQNQPPGSRIGNIYYDLFHVRQKNGGK